MPKTATKTRKTRVPNTPAAAKRPSSKHPEFAALLAASREAILQLRGSGHDGTQATFKEDGQMKHCLICAAHNRLQDALTEFEASALDRIGK